MHFDQYRVPSVSGEFKSRHSPQSRQIPPQSRQVSPQSRHVCWNRQGPLAGLFKTPPQTRQVSPQTRQVSPQSRQVSPQSRQARLTSSACCIVGQHRVPSVTWEFNSRHSRQSRHPSVYIPPSVAHVFPRVHCNNPARGVFRDQAFRRFSMRWATRAWRPTFGIEGIVRRLKRQGSTRV